MMNSLTKILVLLACGLSSFGLHAQQMSWCGDVSVGADALYWKPMSCSYQYGGSIPSGGSETFFTLNPDYDWGFRVFGRYTQGCAYAELSYTWLQTRDAVRHPGTISVPFFGATTVDQLLGAVAQLKIDYQNVDLKAGYYLHRQPCCAFALFANIRWVDISQRRRVRGQSVNAPIGPASLRHKSEFEGAGLGIGIEGEYGLLCGVNAFGSFNLMAIIGERTTPEERVSTSNAGVVSVETFDFRRASSVVPGGEFKLGLNRAVKCYCILATVEVGVQATYYWNVLDSVDQGAGNNKRSCKDLGFAGPYAGLYLSF